MKIIRHLQVRFFAPLRMTSEGLGMTLRRCHSEGAKRPKNLNIEIPIPIFIFLFSLFFLSACKGLPTGPNTVPVANAGTDVSTSINLTAIILDGSGSTDADGNSLTYSWSVVATVGVTSATLDNPTSVSPTLNMTGFDTAGDSVSVQLIVNDGTDNSLPSVVIISHT